MKLGHSSEMLYNISQTKEYIHWLMRSNETNEKRQVVIITIHTEAGERKK